jgi:hypothetical protein
MEVVAESVVFVENASQRRKRVRIRVARPEPDPRGDFQCTVELKGLERRSKIYGVDSFQALVLALRFLETRVSTLLEEGWRFFFREDDHEPLDARLIWLGDATKYEAVALSNERVERTGKKKRRAKSDRRRTRRSRARRWASQQVGE